MTIEEFTDEVLGAEASKYSQEEIEVYYATSVKLFNYLFEKWKKEKFPDIKPLKG